MSKGSGPPPRWLRCPRKGELCHEKFLPFKVPLKAQYDSQVPEEYRFPPRMVFDLMKGRKKKVSNCDNYMFDIKNISDWALD